MPSIMRWSLILKGSLFIFFGLLMLERFFQHLQLLGLYIHPILEPTNNLVQLGEQTLIVHYPFFQGDNASLPVRFVV